MPTVIHVSPHPDDESIAAPCTLLHLQHAGWRVINLAVSLGRPSEHVRREEELAGALSVAGFEHRMPAETIAISRTDDLRVACRALTAELAAVVEETGAELIVGPHPRDGHHGHVAVARAIRQFVWTSPRPVSWWMWSIWADLPRPTLIVECSIENLDTSERMLKEYRGENERNDYLAMHRAARVVNAVRGIEKALGFGAALNGRVKDISHAELLTELTVRDRTWMIGLPRVLDAVDGVEWTRLRDYSILSPARFQHLFRPTVLSLMARMRVPLWPVSAEPLPEPPGAARLTR